MKPHHDNRGPRTPSRPTAFAVAFLALCGTRAAQAVDTAATQTALDAVLSQATTIGIMVLAVVAGMSVFGLIISMIYLTNSSSRRITVRHSGGLSSRRRRY